MKKARVGWLSLLLCLLFARVAEAAVPSSPPRPAWEIVVNIPAFTLSLCREGVVYKEYPVAVGRASTPTPVGKFRILSKFVNPWWRPPGGGNPVPPGPANPLGGWWLGFLRSGYGIHGTNNPSSIGTAVSLGCVRMYNSDVRELFELVPLGTKVRIVYEPVVVKHDPTVGSNYLVVYPDIYGQGAVSLSTVRAGMARAGILASVSREKLEALLAHARRNPVVVSGGILIRFNGELLTTGGEWQDGRVMVPFGPLAERMGFADAGPEEGFGPSMEGEGEASFVPLDLLPEVFQARVFWHPEMEIADIFALLVKVNGKFATAAGFVHEAQPMVPLRIVADRLGLAVDWVPDRSVAVVAEHEVDGVYSGTEFFVSAEMLAIVAGARLHWDPVAHTVDISL